MTKPIIAKSNQHGQILIPFQLRKKYHFLPKQEFRISPYKKGLYIEPIQEKSGFNWEETVVSYPSSVSLKTKKHNNNADFLFSTDNKKSNIAENIDEILYS